MNTLLKGGLIGGVISLILHLISFILVGYSELVDTFFLLVNFPGIVLGFLFFGPNPSLTMPLKIMVAIVVVAFWLFIGAIIGIIVGKYKKKK